MYQNFTKNKEAPLKGEKQTVLKDKSVRNYLYVTAGGLFLTNFKKMV